MTTNVKKIAFLVAPEGIEHSELDSPWNAVEDAGHEPVLISIKDGTIQTYNHLDPAQTYPVDRLVQDVSADEFDALVLPGGVANPDALRTNEQAVTFARTFVESGKPVAAICHAPWTLIETGCLEGKNVTSWPSLKTDLTNAGARWTDEELVVDGNLITSRNPDDLPAFCSAILEAVNHGVDSVTA